MKKNPDSILPTYFEFIKRNTSMKHIFFFVSLILAVPTLFGQTKTVQYGYVHHEVIADPNNGTPCLRGTAFCDGGTRITNFTPASADGCVPAKTTYTEVPGSYTKFTKVVDNDLSTLTSIDYSIKRKSDGVTLYSVTLSSPWPTTPTAYSATLLVAPGTVSVLGTYYKSSDGTIMIKSPSIPGSVVSNSDALIVTVDPSCTPTATPSGTTFSSEGGVDEISTQEYNATAVAAMSTFGKLIPGDVKYSELDADHDGWYKLDGRAIASISNVSAKTVASTLYSGTLPNMSNKYFYAEHANADRLTYDGQNNFTVANSNIQAATITTTTDGSHSHEFFTQNDDLANQSQSFGSRPSSGYNDNGFYNWGTAPIGSAGNHNHTVTIGTGSPSSIDNRPVSKRMYAYVYLGE
jgi:hypothetical protein